MEAYIINFFYFPFLLTNALLKYLSEMITVDRQGDGLGKEAGTGGHCPEEEFPILETFFSYDAEDDDGPEERSQVVQPKPKGTRRFLRRVVFSQECPDPFIMVLG